jgi:hypothetical protein
MKQRDNKNYYIKRKLIQENSPIKLNTMNTEISYTKTIMNTNPSIINRPRLNTLEDHNIVENNLYEYLELDSELDIEGLNLKQKVKINEFLRSKNSFVEKKNFDIKFIPNKNNVDLALSTGGRFDKVHGFFNSVYLKSKQKSLKLNRRSERTDDSDMRKTRMSVIDIKEEYNIHGVNFKLPKLKYVRLTD